MWSFLFCRVTFPVDHHSSSNSPYVLTGVSTPARGKPNAILTHHVGMVYAYHQKSDDDWEWFMMTWAAHMGVSINRGTRVPQNGWFIMEHPIKLDDLEVPLFQETTTSIIWRDRILKKNVSLNAKLYPEKSYRIRTLYMSYWYMMISWYSLIHFWLSCILKNIMKNPYFHVYQYSHQQYVIDTWWFYPDDTFWTNIVDFWLNKLTIDTLW